MTISPCVPVAPRTKTVLAMMNWGKVEALDRKKSQLEK
jgi:hypothetical protein